MTSVFVWGGAALCLLVAVRVVMRFVDPETTPLRRAQDAAVFLVALSGVADFLGAHLDRLSGYQGTGEYVGNVAMAFGAGWTFIYVRTLTTLQPPPRKVLRGVLAIGATLFLVHTLLWLVVLKDLPLEVHQRTLAGRAAEVLNQSWMGAVCAYGAAALGGIIKRLWQSHRSDRIRAVGFSMTAACATIVAAVSACELVVAVLGAFSPGLDKVFSSAKAFAAVLFGVGALIATSIPSLRGRGTSMAEPTTVNGLE